MTSLIPFVHVKTDSFSANQCSDCTCWHMPNAAMAKLLEFGRSPRSVLCTAPAQASPTQRFTFSKSPMVQQSSLAEKSPSNQSKHCHHFGLPHRAAARRWQRSWKKRIHRPVPASLYPAMCAIIWMMLGWSVCLHKHTLQC